MLQKNASTSNALNTLGRGDEAAPPQQPELCAHLDQLSMLMERLSMASHRLGNFLDRTCGPMPESGSTASGPIASGHLGEMHARLMNLIEIADRLEDRVSHLDRIG